MGTVSYCTQIIVACFQGLWRLSLVLGVVYLCEFCIIMSVSKNSSVNYLTINGSGFYSDLVSGMINDSV